MAMHHRNQRSPGSTNPFTGRGLPASSPYRVQPGGGHGNTGRPPLQNMAKKAALLLVSFMVFFYIVSYGGVEDDYVPPNTAGSLKSGDYGSNNRSRGGSRSAGNGGVQKEPTKLVLPKDDGDRSRGGFGETRGLDSGEGGDRFGGGDGGGFGGDEGGHDEFGDRDTRDGFGDGRLNFGGSGSGDNGGGGGGGNSPRSGSRDALGGRFGSDGDRFGDGEAGGFGRSGMHGGRSPDGGEGGGVWSGDGDRAPPSRSRSFGGGGGNDDGMAARRPDDSQDGFGLRGHSRSKRDSGDLGFGRGRSPDSGGRSPDSGLGDGRHRGDLADSFRDAMRDMQGSGSRKGDVSVDGGGSEDVFRTQDRMAIPRAGASDSGDGHSNNRFETNVSGDVKKYLQSLKKKDDSEDGKRMSPDMSKEDSGDVYKDKLTKYDRRDSGDMPHKDRYSKYSDARARDSGDASKKEKYSEYMRGDSRDVPHKKRTYSNDSGDRYHKKTMGRDSEDLAKEGSDAYFKKKYRMDNSGDKRASGDYRKKRVWSPDSGDAAKKDSSDYYKKKYGVKESAKGSGDSAPEEGSEAYYKKKYRMDSGDGYKRDSGDGYGKKKYADDSGDAKVDRYAKKVDDSEDRYKKKMDDSEDRYRKKADHSEDYYKKKYGVKEMAKDSGDAAAKDSGDSKVREYLKLGGDSSDRKPMGGSGDSGDSYKEKVDDSEDGHKKKVDHSEDYYKKKYGVDASAKGSGDAAAKGSSDAKVVEDSGDQSDVPKVASHKCEDDPTFLYKGREGYTCEYIAANRPEKCETLLGEEKVGVASCPVSCKMVDECRDAYGIKGGVEDRAEAPAGDGERPEEISHKCEDNPTFLYKDREGYNCEYIGASRPEKCESLYGGEKIGVVACPVSCKMVDECKDMHGVKGSGGDGAEAPAGGDERPAGDTPGDGHSEGVPQEDKAASSKCKDDSAFLYKDKEGYTCQFIGETKPEKCEKLYNGEKVGIVSCPVSCKMVDECMESHKVETGDVAVETGDGGDGAEAPAGLEGHVEVEARPPICEDDPSFLYKDREGADCKYIGASYPEKCEKLRDGQKIGVVSCPVSCKMVDECMELHKGRESVEAGSDSVGAGSPAGSDESGAGAGDGAAERSGDASRRERSSHQKYIGELGASVKESDAGASGDGKKSVGSGDGMAIHSLRDSQPSGDAKPVDSGDAPEKRNIDDLGASIKKSDASEESGDVKKDTDSDASGDEAKGSGDAAEKDAEGVEASAKKSDATDASGDAKKDAVSGEDSGDRGSGKVGTAEGEASTDEAKGAAEVSEKKGGASEGSGDAKKVSPDLKRSGDGEVQKKSDDVVEEKSRSGDVVGEDRRAEDPSERRSAGESKEPADKSDGSAEAKSGDNKVIEVEASKKSDATKGSADSKEEEKVRSGSEKASADPKSADEAASKKGSETKKSGDVAAENGSKDAPADEGKGDGAGESDGKKDEESEPEKKGGLFGKLRRKKDDLAEEKGRDGEERASEKEAAEEVREEAKAKVTGLLGRLRRKKDGGDSSVPDPSRGLQVSTWNVAAINNNPFEYWITYDEDPNYEKIMTDIESFLEEPTKKTDVPVSEVFTEEMFSELEKRMDKVGWDSVRSYWDKDFKNRKIISEFIKDPLLGSKRLASMPDRITNTINVVDSDEPVFRPTVINQYEGDLSNLKKWWSAWEKFMFDTPLKIKKKDEVITASPYEMLQKIRKSKYPDITEEEEKVSLPLQTMCGAIFDAILVHMMNTVSKPDVWQPLKNTMVENLNKQKIPHTLEILENAYGESAIITLQEVSASLIDQAKKRALGDKFWIVAPADMDAVRDQNSVILLCKKKFPEGSGKEITALVESSFEDGANVPVAKGDILAITAKDQDGTPYVIASFHGDTNGLATKPVVSAVMKAMSSESDLAESKLIFGLDANTYEKATSGKQQDVLEFGEHYVSLGLTSAWGDVPNPSNYTTFNSRTYLQPQLNKACKKSDKRAKGDVNPKDFILTRKKDFKVTKTWKDNTGEKKYIENMAFPTLKFPSDHGILATILKPIEAASENDGKSAEAKLNPENEGISSIKKKK